MSSARSLLRIIASRVIRPLPTPDDTSIDWRPARAAARTLLAWACDVALATQVALAMIARAAPSLQLFNVGLSVLIAAGATVFMASLGDVAAGLGGHFATLAPTLDRVLSELAQR